MSGDTDTLRERHAAAVSHACRLLADAHQPPNLDELARQVGYSRFQFHRVFKAVVGVTPHACVAAGRAERVRDLLSSAERVSDAIYGAGFNSNGHFYASTAEILGMTPTSFRAGGQGARIHPVLAHCSLGRVLVAVSGWQGRSARTVCAVLVGGEAAMLRSRLSRRFPAAEIGEPDVRLRRLVSEAVHRAELPDDSRALLEERVQAIAFQVRVRQQLRAVTGADDAGAC